MPNETLNVQGKTGWVTGWGLLNEKFKFLESFQSNKN